MFCPKCGTIIPDDAMFCGKCGLRLASQPAGAQAGTRADAQSQQPVIQPQGQARVQPGHRSSNVETLPASAGKKKSPLPIIIAIVAIVVVIGVGVFVFNSATGGDSNSSLSTSAVSSQVSQDGSASDEASSASEANSDEESEDEPYTTYADSPIVKEGSLRAFAKNPPNLVDLVTGDDALAADTLEWHDRVKTTQRTYFTSNKEFCETYKKIPESQYGSKLGAYSGHYLFSCSNGFTSITQDDIKKRGSHITSVTCLQVVNVSSISPEELAAYVKAIAPYDEIYIDATASDGHLEGLARGNGCIIPLNAYHFGDIWTVKVGAESIENDIHGSSDNMSFEQRYKDFTPASPSQGYKA